MSTEWEFRELAKRCVRFAAEAQGNDERAMYLDVANALTRIAALHSDTARVILFERSAIVERRLPS